MINKMKCLINGKLFNCKTVENMGYQNGYHVRAVIHDNKEYIVIKDNGQWRTVEHAEKIRQPSNYCGQ
jgi:hypothetical protein